MSDNQAIRFLRGTTRNIGLTSTTLLAGQPLIDTDKNLLYVGTDGGTAINKVTPVRANLNIQGFWEDIKYNNQLVRVGDRSFIEIGGKMLPALCLSAGTSSSERHSTWQINYNQHHSIGSTSTSTWGNTSMFRWLNGSEVLGSMPQYMQNCIAEVSRSGATSKLWLLSAEEIFGTSNLPSWVVRDSTHGQFIYYRNLIGEGAAGNSYNTALYCNTGTFLRSKYNNTGDNNFWCYLDSSGRLAYMSGSSATTGVTFCFEIDSTN